MKRLLLVLSLVSIPALTSFADLSAFQSTIASPTGGGAAPTYWWTFDNTLTNSGSGAGGVLTEGNGLGGNLGGYTNDLFGNVDSARYMGSLSNSLSTGTDVISGGSTLTSGDSTAAGKGTLVLTFKTPDVAISASRYLFAQGHEGTPVNSFALWESTGGFLNLRTGNGSTNLTALSLSTWYYFVITWDETRGPDENHFSFGQVGGVLTNGIRNPSNSSVMGNNGTFTIGNSATTNSNGYIQGTDPGRIDEFAIYNYELSQTQINDQFAAIVIPEPSTLLLCGLSLVSLFVVTRRRRTFKR
jgi:hypothetical protein